MSQTDSGIIPPEIDSMNALFRPLLLLPFALLLAMLSHSASPHAALAEEPKAEKKWVDVDGDPLPEGVIARVGSARWRVSATTRISDLSPDGKYLVATDSFSALAVHDAANGRCLLRQPLDMRHIRLTKVLPDSKSVFVADSEKWCEVSLPDGKLLRQGRLPDKMYEVSLSADGKTVLAGTRDNKIVWLDRKTGAKSGEAQMTLRPLVLDDIDGNRVFVRDSNRAVMYDRDQRVVLWEKGGDPVGKSACVSAVSPDRKRMIYAASNPRQRERFPLYLLDVATGAKVADLDPKGTIGGVETILFSADGKRLFLTHRYRGTQVVDAATGAMIRDFPCDTYLQAAHPHPDGRTLLCVQGDGAIERIDLTTGKPLPVAAREVSCAGFASETSLVVVRESRLRTVDYRTSRDLEVGIADLACPLAPSALSVSADRHAVAVGRWTRDDLLTVYDRRTGAKRDIDGVGTTHALALSGDGRTLYVGENRPSIGEFDAASGKKLLELGDHKSALVDTLLLSPSGKILASASTDDSLAIDTAVRIRDLGADRIVCRIPLDKWTALDLAFSPDGASIAVVGGVPGAPNPTGEVHIHDTATGELLASFDGHEEKVRHVAFAPDGRSLATASEDGTVRIWEIATQHQRHILPARKQRYEGLWYSPSGGLLATRTGEDGILIHDLYGRQRPSLPALTPAEAADACAGLTSPEAKEAFAAIRRLVASPDLATKALGEAVKVSPMPSDEEVAGWLKDIGSASFAERRRGQRGLSPFASELQGTLKKERETAIESDRKGRLDSLLEEAKAISPAWLRTLRGIEVLERIGTPEARKLLEALAAGGDDRRTREAKASLGRLK